MAATLCSAGMLYAQTELDPACVAGTLQSYITDFGPTTASGCSVGINNYNDFTFSSSGTGGATLDGASDIEVTPSIEGFTLSQVNMDPFSVAMGQTALYDISYLFVIDPVPQMGAADLGMDPPFGAVSIDQYYCPDSYLTTDANAAPLCQVPDPDTFYPQDLHVDDTNPPNSWDTGLVALDPPVLDFANVLTVIDIDGTTGTCLTATECSGFDSVTGNSFDTPAVPEPFTWALSAGGLLAIIIRKRLAHGRS